MRNDSEVLKRFGRRVREFTHLHRCACVIDSTMRDKTVVVGVRPTALGALSRTLDPERRPSALTAGTCRAAVEDAGLATEAVDDMRIWPPGKRSPWRHGAQAWQRPTR